jgi:biopolymer transport protein ExbB
MNTAFFGDGPSRRSTPVKFILAAAAMAFLPMGALAQEPTAPPTDVPAPVVEDVNPTPDLAPAPAAEPAAPAAEEAGGEEVAETENPFGLAHMWEVADWVGRSVFIVMVLMFSGVVYISVTKLIDQNSLISQMKKLGGFWEASSLDEGLDSLGQKNAFRAIAEGAIAQANSAQAGLGARISRGDRTSHQVGIELERVNQRLSAGMAFLATVGAVCPFVGLMGTVWGIVNALTRIGMTGDASIEKVAGPVGEALIQTFIGLLVAVPAVIMYNLLGRRNKNISDAARHFAYDVEKLMASTTRA